MSTRWLFAHRGVISALLLAVGTIILNLLNGQTLTNAIIFLVLCV